ncbi:hypothetical protein [Umezawaea sp. NPDC059074]|uniref:hypothetical protein n=1 Tax=Umezawaea sp. NPDC059074 TaxID=3346716 RepID=UPI00367C1B5F
MVNRRPLDRSAPAAAPELGRLIAVLFAAGAPLWRSLAASVTVDRPVVVCDAVSPAQIAVLTASPDLVVDGLVLVARALGVHRVHLRTPSGIGSVAVRRALSRRGDPVRIVVEQHERPGDVVHEASDYVRLAQLVT